MRTLPVARASGMVSCMRLRQRTNVDLPQPEGPMTAVAWLASAFMLILRRAWVLPNQAFKFSTWMPTPILLVCSLERSPAGGQADRAYRGDDQHNQDQRARPRLAMPFIERRNGVVENLQRQRRRGLVELPIPE